MVLDLGVNTLNAFMMTDLDGSHDLGNPVQILAHIHHQMFNILTFGGSSILCFWNNFC